MASASARHETGRACGLWYVARRPSVPGPWPLLLFLHGYGERGSACGSELDRVLKHGPWSARNIGEFFVLAPQCPKGKIWPGMVDELLALVSHVRKANEIDGDRCFATGLSMGAFGLWALVHRRPGLFRAIAPVCGGFTPPTSPETSMNRVMSLAKAAPLPRDVRSLRKLRVWFFHGRKDNMVDVKGSEATYRKLGGKSRGDDELRLTVYDSGHSCWRKAYETDDLLQWLAAAPKKGANAKAKARAAAPRMPRMKAAKAKASRTPLRGAKGKAKAASTKPSVDAPPGRRAHAVLISKRESEARSSEPPADEPVGHRAHAVIRFDGSRRNPVVYFKWNAAGKQIHFQASVSAASNSRHAAEVIARACFRKFEQGWEKPAVIAFRNKCYERLRDLGPERHASGPEASAFLKRPAALESSLPAKRAAARVPAATRSRRHQQRPECGGQQSPAPAVGSQQGPAPATAR